MPNGSTRKNVGKEFLGTGLAFPLQMNPARRFKLVGGEEDINQSIQIILGTAPGERLMRPEFGCRVHELIFAPYDSATEALVIFYVEEALAFWEPRIQVTEVIIDAERDEGVILVHIRYLIKATHDERSIVYPFYIEDEA